MPRGEILDIWLDTATRKRKQETKGDHTGAGDDPAAGIPSVGALSLTLTLSLSLTRSPSPSPPSPSSYVWVRGDPEPTCVSTV